ncbi:ABC transporter permease [Mumia quercus]|uniref:ABC transporter permease n=1 Tax=Mumia quercus TaxID=2976125 RepID=UPI0021D2BA28|nr:ABC transporter permease [Mumia quercus]
MSTGVARWRLALRMARRDARRSKGRSALVAAMVGVPVMIVVVLTTVIATGDVSAEENLPATVGQAAARVSWGGAGAVSQDPDGIAGGTGAGDSPWGQERPPASALQEVLPEATLVPVRSGRAVVSRALGAVDVLEVDAAEPATEGLVMLSDGDLPRTVDEVVLSPGLADGDIETGDTVTLGGSEREVVGIGTYESVAASPGRHSLVTMPGSGLLDAGASTDYLVVQDAPVTWDDVKRLNGLGFMVVSRSVVENPPPKSEQYAELVGWDRDDAAREVLAIVVTAIVLQVVLLAGPAFAVGVRRQRRDLALLAAAGGGPADVRRAVLAQALLLGLGAGALGAVLGLALSPAVVALIPRWFDNEAFGPFDVMWSAVVAAVLLGAVAAFLAALVPARQVANQEVSAALAGRPSRPGRRNGWPLVGVALVVVGLALCFTRGVRPGGETAVAVGTIAVVLGTVFLTPLVLAGVGRLGGALPLPLRLAVRDTTRQRARSTPAVAAVMATVAGITALAIAGASDFEQNRREYTFSYPPGTTVLSEFTSGVDDAGEAAGRAAGVSFTPLGSAGAEQIEGGDGRFAHVWVESGRDDEWAGLTQVAVATPDELAAWGVELSPSQADALRSGQALVSPSARDADGRLRLTVDEESDGETTSRDVVLDGQVAELGMGPVPQGPEPTVARAVISPETARAQGIPYERVRAVAGEALSAEQLRQVRAALRDLPGHQGLHTERGFQETFTLQLLLLVGAGGLAVLVGTLSATGLALVDARPDLATLAAVGAGPATRRTVAAAQAVVLGVLGAAMGVAVGFAPGLAATWPLTSDRWVGSPLAEDAGPVIDIPWGILATIVVVVPLVAAAASALVTRGHVPLTRRLAQ